MLVTGGDTGAGTTATAERYHLATGTWSPVASMHVPRYGHTATLLPSGKVLVVGGDQLGTGDPEVYDPAADTWISTAPMTARRYAHTATLLPSGKVLVVGGVSYAGALINETTELYDPATNAWSLGAPLSTARFSHTATLLPSGQILVTGERPSLLRRRSRASRCMIPSSMPGRPQRR